MRSLKLFAKQLFRAKDKLVNAKFIVQRPLMYKKLFSQEFWRSVTIIIWKQVFYTFTVYCNTLRQSIFPIYLMILLQRVVLKLILLWRSCFTSYWSHKISLELEKLHLGHNASAQTCYAQLWVLAIPGAMKLKSTLRCSVPVLILLCLVGRVPLNEAALLCPATHYQLSTC